MADSQPAHATEHNGPRHIVQTAVFTLSHAGDRIEFVRHPDLLTTKLTHRKLGVAVDNVASRSWELALSPQRTPTSLPEQLAEVAELVAATASRR